MWNLFRILNNYLWNKIRSYESFKHNDNTWVSIIPFLSFYLTTLHLSYCPWCNLPKQASKIKRLLAHHDIILPRASVKLHLCSWFDYSFYSIDWAIPCKTCNPLSSTVRVLLQSWRIPIVTKVLWGFPVNSSYHQKNAAFTQIISIFAKKFWPLKKSHSKYPTPEEFNSQDNFFTRTEEFQG